MNRLLLVATCCTVALYSSAFQLPYKNLKKTYENHPDKCLERAESWMRLFPNNPAPYYYASLVHFEQAQEEEKTRKKYNELSKSLKYARELELLKMQSFLAKVEWDTLTPHIGSMVAEVKDALEEEDLNALSASLDKKARRFDWAESEKSRGEEHYTFTIVPTNSNNSNTTTISGFRNGQYFGKPTGQEMITSYSVAGEREMLKYINAERIKQGMKELEWDEDLARAARYHAFDMGSQDYFSHDSQDLVNGKLMEVNGTFERIKAFYKKSFVNSENIAAGNEGAKDTYMQWYNSPGHYANMFNKSSAKAGVGVCYVSGSSYGYYWVFCTALD